MFMSYGNTTSNMSNFGASKMKAKSFFVSIDLFFKVNVLNESAVV